MACETTALPDGAADFCCVTSDPYWQARLAYLRTLAGLESTSPQDLVIAAKAHVAQWGLMSGL